MQMVEDSAVCELLITISIQTECNSTYLQICFVRTSPQTQWLHTHFILGVRDIPT